MSRLFQVFISVIDHLIDVVDVLLGLVLDATDEHLIRPLGDHVVTLPGVLFLVVNVVNPVIGLQ